MATNNASFDHVVESLDFEGLLAELKNEDDYRRESALVAAYRLTLLVDLRAAANGTTFDDEWKTIFDHDRMMAEMNGGDPARAVAAFEAFDAVTYVEALRYAEDTPSTPDIKARALAVIARIDHLIEERFGYRRKQRQRN